MINLYKTIFFVIISLTIRLLDRPSDMNNFIFSSPVRSAGRTIVVTSVSASASASGFFFLLKFFKDPYLLNPLMDQLDTFTNDR